VNVVHIKDVVSGHLAAFDNGRRGARYILGGENLSVRWLIQVIAEVAGIQAPNLFIPTGLVRALSKALTLIQPFVRLPVDANLLQMAGRYFYYDSRRAYMELGVLEPLPARQAIQEGYDWFAKLGVISKKRTTTTLQARNEPHQGGSGD